MRDKHNVHFIICILDMVYIHFQGGLANNLFEFGAARSISEDVVICAP